MPYTQQQVDELSEAIASGVLSVRHADGRSTTFQSLDAMRKARREMLAEIERESGNRRRRNIRAYQKGTGL